MFFVVLRQRFLQELVVITTVIGLFVAGQWLFTEVQPQTGVPATAVPQKPVENVAADGVVLTFNLSWGTQVIQDVLDVLENANQPATFFLSGPWLDTHPELAADIRRSGHDTSSLGHHYRDYTGMTAAEVEQELAAADASFQKILDQDPRWFRPPKLAVDDTVLQVAREKGKTVVLGQIVVPVWQMTDPETLVEWTMQRVEPGSIIVIQADDVNPHLPETLRMLLERLRQESLTVLPLSGADVPDGQ